MSVLPSLFLLLVFQPPSGRIDAFDDLLEELLAQRDVSGVPRLHELARENQAVFDHAVTLMADAYRSCRRHGGRTDHPKRLQLNWLIELLEGQPLGVARRVFADLVQIPGTLHWYTSFRGMFTNEITLVANEHGIIRKVIWED